MTRRTAASKSLISVIAASPNPDTSASRSLLAWTASAKLPNFWMMALASGFVSRRGGRFAVTSPVPRETLTRLYAREVRSTSPTHAAPTAKRVPSDPAGCAFSGAMAHPGQNKERAAGRGKWLGMLKARSSLSCP